MEYRTHKTLLTGKISDEVNDLLVFWCEQANSLYNSVLFAIRQSHFGTCPTYEYFDQYDWFRSRFQRRYIKANYPELCKQFKDNIHYQALGGQQGQQLIKSVVEGVKSYNQLLKADWNEEGSLMSNLNRSIYASTKKLSD